MKEDKVLANNPGKILAQKRQELGFSVETISEKLNLKLNIIQDLESWDLSKMPAVVFIKGYIRAYAKFLSLNAEELLQDFNSYHIPTNQENTIAKISFKNNKRNKSSRIPYLRILSVATLSFFVIVLIFWQYTKVSDISHDITDKRQKLSKLSLTDLSKMHKVIKTTESSIHG